MVDDLERIWSRIVAVLLVTGGVAFGLLLGFPVGRYVFPALPHEAPGTTVAQADGTHVAAKARTDTITHTVTRLVERWHTDTTLVRDTITIRDTVYRIVNAAVFDSTLRACSELASSCQAERAAAAKVRAALRDSITVLQPRFRDRLGIYVGYGGTAAPGGTLTHGAQLGVGVRVWP